MPPLPRRSLTRRTGAIAMSVCALVLCASTPATASDAATLTFSGTRQAHAGASARLQATLSAPAPSCNLYAGATLLDRVVPRAKDLVWTLRLPARARAQALLLRLSCGAEQARVVLHVLGPTRGTRVRGLEASVRQEGPALPSPQSSTASEGEEAPAPAPCTDAYTCSPVNNPSIVPGDEAMPLSAGNCTDWAEYKRPDIWYNQAANDPLGQDWDAWTWAEHAQAEGLSVGAVPQVGDIAVWQPNTAHSGPVGHVAYVESVGQGSITVSEMNAPFDPVTLKTPEGYTYYESTLTEAELTEQSVQFIAPAS